MENKLQFHVTRQKMLGIISLGRRYILHDGSPPFHKRFPIMAIRPADHFLFFSNKKKTPHPFLRGITYLLPTQLLLPTHVRAPQNPVNHIKVFIYLFIFLKGTQLLFHLEISFS